jgi:hypothetical protein
VHFHTDFTSELLKQIWLFTYPYGFRNPVWIYGLKINDMRWYVDTVHLVLSIKLCANAQVWLLLINCHLVHFTVYAVSFLLVKYCSWCSTWYRHIMKVYYCHNMLDSLGISTAHFYRFLGSSWAVNYDSIEWISEWLGKLSWPPSLAQHMTEETMIAPITFRSHSILTQFSVQEEFLDFSDHQSLKSGNGYLPPYRWTVPSVGHLMWGNCV